VAAEPRRPPARPEAKESLIAAELTIEGRIEGTGSVRLAGRFKGDVAVQGDVSIDPGAAGATRVCPHCKAQVLASSAICPGCQHHLRFNATDARPEVAGYPALRVEGSFQHPEAGLACEYTVVVALTNERGERLARQVVNVGALQPGESRSVSLSVEILPVAAGGVRRN